MHVHKGRAFHWNVVLLAGDDGPKLWYVLRLFSL